MITRINIGDVVRLTRTGEVGTVRGLVDHTDLARHGTILDVQLSTEKVIQANGLALEFVAPAKLKASRWALVAVFALSALVSGTLGYYLADQGVPVWLAVLFGMLLYPTFDRGYTQMFLRPRKQKVTLPPTRVGTAAPRQGREAVNKG